MYEINDAANRKIGLVHWLVDDLHAFAMDRLDIAVHCQFLNRTTNPKSFRDSNGDGIGDLGGVIEKLDYLQGLGVDYLWLTPFFVSPQRDNGYDVADYYAIDPIFGTMQDVERLIDEAKQRGMGIMLDMVFNHTSTEHEWFQRALTGEKEYQDYYIFREGVPDQPPTNWLSKFGGSAWEYVPGLGKWYLHLFDRTQADLNWENPQVREALKEIIRFWKQKSIEGFRFDVVNLISKPEVFQDDDQGDGRRFYTDGHHVHQFLQELVRDTGIGGMITVGEMSSTSIDNCVRYSNPAEHELSMCFSFHHLKIDYKNGDKWQLMEPDIPALKQLLMDWQLAMQEHDGWNALFWCNHDQPRIVSRLGDTRRYWRESAKMLALCMHFMRGTPYIYQGEELGMGNAGFTSLAQYRDVESRNYYKILRERGVSETEALQILAARSRDNSRTPMQWSAEKNAGFSEQIPWIPLAKDWQKVNAAQEVGDQCSVFSWYQSLIRLRHERAVIATGRIAFLSGENPAILAFRRYGEGPELAAFCNFSADTVPVAGNWQDYHLLLDSYDRGLIEGPYLILRPYEGLVLEQKRFMG